jgi:hypothetical protein
MENQIGVLPETPELLNMDRECNVRKSIDKEGKL